MHRALWVIGMWAVGQSAGMAAPGEDPAARALRLDEAYAQMHAAQVKGDAPACFAAFEAVRADVLNDATHASVRAWAGRVGCVHLAGWTQSTPSAAAYEAVWLPAMRHFSQPPPGVEPAPGAFARVAQSLWNGLRSHGHTDRADALEAAQVERWLASATATPPDAAAVAALMQFAQGYYGARPWGALMAHWHARFAQRLGPGHRVTLTMLRARIFNHRQLSRPAQALALSDQFAALLAAHQADDERLAMDNRSERIGALAGVGRFADALDEGTQLLVWLQSRQPTPHASIMRTAYKLAGLCIEMADHDAAIAYAQLAVDAGAKAAQFSDRHEALFAFALREQARMLRGDADGPEALRGALQAITSYDLAVTDALYTLTRHAQLSGATELHSWAKSTFDRLIRTQTGPLQPERALPLYLEVLAGPAGTEPNLERASHILAYGLLGGDTPLTVHAHFALARQVAVHQADGAIWLYKRGAQALQALRQGLPEATQGVHKAWLSEHEGDLRAFIGLLIDNGRLAEAQQAIEVLREEELHEFRRRSRGASAMQRRLVARLSFTPDERQRNSGLQHAEQALREARLAADARADRRLVWAERNGSPDAQAQSALESAARTVRALAQAAPASHPRATDPAAIALPAGQARLSFFMRAHTVEAVVETAATRQRVRLPHSAAEVSRAVQALRAELARPGLQVPAHAALLHRWLIEPLRRHLLHIRHLHLAPDGVLRYVPFSALHDGRRYLAQSYSLSMAISARAPVARPAPGGRPRLVAFGKALPDAEHGALPGVRDELAVLGALRGAQVAQAMDQGFTSAALLHALKQTPDVVHLASHFVLDAAGEETSYLLLGDGSRLSLRQLRELPWAGVNLALLSACDSGLALDAPGSAAQGRELAGFAATLHAAGVRNVMATLWRIDDTATSRWMQAFYAPWQQAGRPVPLNARHLARVQRDWLRRHAGTALAHPYHWAAFSWIGDPS